MTREEKVNKTLHLVLKGKWYNMIANGEKTEEYREIKPYWIHRLLDSYEMTSIMTDSCFGEFLLKLQGKDLQQSMVSKHFTEVKFQLGYRLTDSMTFQIKSSIHR